MPYVSDDGRILVGAITKAHADRMIADLTERSPGIVTKAATFHPDSPTRVLIGQRPGYPRRTSAEATTDAFYAAVELVRRAFVQAEGREPTDTDDNFHTAVQELHERYFPKDARLTPAPVKKRRGGGMVADAMRANLAPVRKANGGSAIRAAMNGERAHMEVTARTPVRKAGRTGAAAGALAGNRVLIDGGSDGPTPVSKAYSRAVDALRDEFVKAEGRQPTDKDRNYTEALGELFTAFFEGGDK